MQFQEFNQGLAGFSRRKWAEGTGPSLELTGVGPGDPQSLCEPTVCFWGVGLPAGSQADGLAAGP